MSLLRHIALGALSLISAATAQAATTWQTLAAGIAYTRLPLTNTLDNGGLHAFRIDLSKYRLDVALARDYGVTSASVRELAERRNAVVAINGGFFSPGFQPLGLRASNGAIKQALKSVSWWSVFSIAQGRASMLPPNQFQMTPATEMAVQSGPRLLVNGAIPPLKDGEDARSALCITATQQVIIAVTDNAELTTEDFAKLLRKPERTGGLGCIFAQNLDGGRSSQLYARLGKFQLHVPNLSPVSDAVVVVPRDAH